MWLLVTLCVFLFVLFLAALILGLSQKKTKLLLIAVVFFLLFCGAVAGTAVYFGIKTYGRIAKSFKPRTGIEIYKALWGDPQSDCVHVLSHRDQIIPKIDYAIWLEYQTCPSEVSRQLNTHSFSYQKVPNTVDFQKIPLSDNIQWFDFKKLGDTVLVYEYSSADLRNIQTIWISKDSTFAYCRDIFD